MNTSGIVETAAERQAMFAQVPIARMQLESLRVQAEAAVSRVRQKPAQSRIGDVLSAVMLAGFVLELGLKIFYMAYGHSRPRGHDLDRLFVGLPRQIRDDISLTYASAASRPIIRVYGLTVSSQQPNTTPQHQPSRYDTAESVLISSKNAFVNARYFFEQATSEGWSTIEDASHYMLELSRALDVVYDAYVKRGGWGDDHFQTDDMG